MSVELLARRMAEVPQAVEDTLARGLPPLKLALAGRRWSVTAAGVSEGPARMLVQLLGPRARFVPLSVLATSSEAERDVLVLFSQGLCPNARIALARAKEYRDALLFTSSEVPQGIETVILPPREPESGMLLRVLGPAIARAAAIALAARILAAEGLAAPAIAAPQARLEAAMSRANGLACGERVVFVAHGADVDWARALAWKWMEGLWLSEPPTWDVLQFAHGPLQSIYDERVDLITLEREGCASSALFDRLGALLRPGLHRRLSLRATYSGPLAALEHDAATNALLLSALRLRPRALDRWPGMGEDAALYGLDAPIVREGDG